MSDEANADRIIQLQMQSMPFVIVYRKIRHRLKSAVLPNRVPKANCLRIDRLNVFLYLVWLAHLKHDVLIFSKHNSDDRKKNIKPVLTFKYTHTLNSIGIKEWNYKFDQTFKMPKKDRVLLSTFLVTIFFLFSFCLGLSWWITNWICWTSVWGCGANMCKQSKWSEPAVLKWLLAHTLDCAHKFC